MRVLTAGWLRGKGLLLLNVLSGVLRVAWSSAQAGHKEGEHTVAVLQAPGGLNRRLAQFEEFRSNGTPGRVRCTG